MCKRWLAALILGIATTSRAQVQPHHPTWVRTDLLSRVRNQPRIFVSNAGQDEVLSTDTDYSDLAVGNLYNALAEWPGVKMVDAPANADLIFQIRTTEGLKPVETRAQTRRQFAEYSDEVYVTLHVSVLDSRSRRLLWKDRVVLRTDTLTRGNLYNQGLEELLDPFIEGVPLPPLPQKLPIAPLPAGLRAPKTLFLTSENGSVPPALMTELEDALHQQFATEYTMVDSAGKADLVVALSATSPNADAIKYGHLSYEAMRVNEIDPKTGILLWSITTAFTRSEKTPQLQIAHTMPYFWRKWKLVANHTGFLY